MADFSLNNLNLRSVCTFVVLALAWPTAVPAQTDTLTLQGHVHANGGKPLAGVVLRIISTTRKFQQQTKTDDFGAFKFPGLQSGKYSLKARLAGLQQSIALEGRSLSADLVMTATASPPGSPAPESPAPQLHQAMRRGNRQHGGGAGCGRFGANRIRGCFFDSYRNSVFDARPFAFSGIEQRKQQYLQNNFGVMLGGPLNIPTSIEEAITPPSSLDIRDRASDPPISPRSPSPPRQNATVISPRPWAATASPWHSSIPHLSALTPTGGSPITRFPRGASVPSPAA
ncbi:MAG: carboxypeptidase regulatory-like domain-containing protein [Acidobacteria bacterium]|nr:carboxypeptidase regulatory-like domain-containing protein [Acidobacteriota bacterium]